jgi:hypothetical protein
VHLRKLTLAAATAALAFSALPSAASAADVCNEAENSHRGGYTVNGGPVDPNPPAFLRGSQMRVGNGHGNGLENAAFHSPALRTCGPVTDPTDPTDPTNPTDPTDPTTPTDPTDPTDPTNPTDPTDPGGPVSPI